MAKKKKPAQKRARFNRLMSSGTKKAPMTSEQMKQAYAHLMVN